ncbi:MAG: RNA-binding transcriptional accessory protein [Clostridiales Family XIII bacterium]|jgi:uncharacterized protein|nr:RNA-binding transcriptional accessory protein [Clostridiales Family XIII bacterium]
MNITMQLATEFSVQADYVDNITTLIDEGNTIPFIARYRKELTGSMDDQILRELSERLEYLRNLEETMTKYKATIEEQGNLTEELAAKIDNAKTLAELDDIYRPFRPKRRTRATIAMEKGLQPLALEILQMSDNNVNVYDLASSYIDAEKEVLSAQDAVDGAKDIIAEMVSDDADIRNLVREATTAHGVLTSTAKDAEEKTVYEMYYDFTESVSKVAGHRVLAINRGEKEGVLSVNVVVDSNLFIGHILKMYNLASTLRELMNQEESYKERISALISAAKTDGADVDYSSFKLSAQLAVYEAIIDSYARLIAPSIEREIRNNLTEMAEDGALKVFKENLRQLIMQQPIAGKVVLALDPGFRMGCKYAVIDGLGNPHTTGVIYPTFSDSKVQEAKSTVLGLIQKYDVDIIAIGNGTASRETEKFVVDDVLRNVPQSAKKIAYIIVNEAGASVYSASPLAAKEFPEYDVNVRSAVSIGRRLQDPMAELVKIDPKSIGVGQYQHDLNQKRLGETLGGVVEDCVNTVGVDLNTASSSLLSYVAGISGKLADNIITYRDEIGRYTSRTELKKVAKLGPKAFTQCAGFLRIPDAKNPLDNTSVHPESYAIATELLKHLGTDKKKLTTGAIDPSEVATLKKSKDRLSEELGVGVPTLLDILNELEKPGRDPRTDMPAPVLRSDVLEMEDLKEGMILKGTVRNVIDFGAFIDIGVHQDGLVHISQIADRFIKHPLDAVKLGDIVDVKVLGVDIQKKRISLTMKI